jgi:hypothetical protein
LVPDDERGGLRLRLRRSAPQLASVGTTANRIGLLYETHVATLLEQLGYRVERTPTTGDMGADLLAFPSADHKLPAFAVQCKAWEEPVGISAVQEVYAAQALHHADLAALVVSSRLTPEAEAAAAALRVLVIVLPITGGADLTLPPASEYRGPGSGRVLDVQEANRLAFLACADDLGLSTNQRSRWQIRATRTELVRRQDGRLVFEVDVLLRKYNFWKGEQTRFYRTALDAESGELLLVREQASRVESR